MKSLHGKMITNNGKENEKALIQDMKNNEKKKGNIENVFYLHTILHILLLIIKKLSALPFVEVNKNNLSTSLEYQTLKLKLKLKLQLLVLPYTEKLTPNVENKLQNQTHPGPSSPSTLSEPSEKNVSIAIWNEIQDLLKFSSHEMSVSQSTTYNKNNNEIENLKCHISVLTATHKALKRLLFILTMSMEDNPKVTKEIPIRTSINSIQANTSILQNSVPQGIIPDKNYCLRSIGTEKEREEVWISLLAFCGTLQSLPCTAAFLTFSLRNHCASPTYPSSSPSSTNPSSSSSSFLPIASSSTSSSSPSSSSPSPSSPSSMPPMPTQHQILHNNNNKHTDHPRYDLFTEKYVTAMDSNYISIMLQVVNNRVSVLQHQRTFLRSLNTSEKNDITDITCEDNRTIESEIVMLKLKEADELWAAVLYILNAATLPSTLSTPLSSTSSYTSSTPHSSTSHSSHSSTSTTTSTSSSSTSSTSSSSHSSTPSSSFPTPSSISLHTAAYFFGRLIISWNDFNIPIKMFEMRTLDLLSGITEDSQSLGALLLSALRLLILKWKKSPPVHCVCGHTSYHTLINNSNRGRNPNLSGSTVECITRPDSSGGKNRDLGPLGKVAGTEEIVEMQDVSVKERKCLFCQAQTTRIVLDMNNDTDVDWLKRVHSVPLSNNFLISLI